MRYIAEKLPHAITNESKMEVSDISDDQEEWTKEYFLDKVDGLKDKFSPARVSILNYLRDHLAQVEK